MKRRSILAAGGLCVALLAAFGGHADPRREGFRGAPSAREFGGFRGGPSPSFGYERASPRGYDFERPPAYAAPPRYRSPGPSYRSPSPTYRSPSPNYRPPPSPYGPQDQGYRSPGPVYRSPYSGYAPPAPAYRQNSLGADWREQQEEARAGVRQGQMAPLGRVIQGIGRRAAGRPLDAGIEYQGSRAVYRVRWMTAHGRRVDYIVDAATGAILSQH